MKKSKKSPSLLAASLLAAGLCGVESTQAVISTLRPFQDAYVYSSAGIANNGSAGNLDVANRYGEFLGDKRAYLTFDGHSLPGNVVLNRATLRVYLTAADGGGTVEVHPVTSGWTEGAVTWDARPTLGPRVAAATVGAPTGRWVEFDVTALAKPALEPIGPNRGLCLALTPDTASTTPFGFMFSSREGAHPPELVLDFAADDSDGEIVVRVDQAWAFEGHDDGIGTQEDFYIKIWVDGHFVQSRHLDGRDHATWSPAVEARATVNKSRLVYPVKIELWDEDDFLNLDDDKFDISVTPRQSLDLLFNACSRTWQENDTIGTHGPGPVVTPGIDERSLLGDNPGRISLNIDTGDGLSFSKDDIAVNNVTPIQAVEDPAVVIDGKPSVVKVTLSSTYTGSQPVVVTCHAEAPGVDVTASRAVIIPPGITDVMLFDGIANPLPFVPGRGGEFHNLCLTVNIEVAGETGSSSCLGVNDCRTANNHDIHKCWSIIRTHDKRVNYVAWDMTEPTLTGGPVSFPTFGLLTATANANEDFRKATYPINAVDPRVLRFPMITPYSGDPVVTLFMTQIPFRLAGMERVVLMPRQGWFADRNHEFIGDYSHVIGLSLAEFGPTVCIAEAGFSECAAHEIGHTYWQSQHSCSTGGIWEYVLNCGCRDEYKHAASDGRPYMGNGYDVEGAIYPFGNVGRPGREVQAVNFMDTTPALIGSYDRWIDQTAFNDLALRMKDAADPKLLVVAGKLFMSQNADGSLSVTNAVLEHGFWTEGTPDFDLDPTKAQNGEGNFRLRFKGGGRETVFAFTPTTPNDGPTQNVVYFSFALPWTNTLDQVSFEGPTLFSHIGNELDLAPTGDRTLAEIVRSKNAPRIRQIVGTAGGVDQDLSHGPATLNSGGRLTLRWTVDDADGAKTAFQSVVLAKPNSGGGDWFPCGQLLNGEELVLDYSTLGGTPGDYSLKVIVADDLNASEMVIKKAFHVGRPLLSMIPDGEKLRLSWPVTLPEYSVLQADESMSKWHGVNYTVRSTDGMFHMELPLSAGTGFFKLENKY